MRISPIFLFPSWCQHGWSICLTEFNYSAALDPPQLLKSTEIAVGGPELLALHEKLSEVNKKLLSESSDIDKQEAILKDLQDRNQKLAAEVAKFRERRGPSILSLFPLAFSSSSRPPSSSRGFTQEEAMA